MLLEASGLDFVSILKGLGWILGGFGVVLGMDFRGFWVILDCSDILRYWGISRRSCEGLASAEKIVFVAIWALFSAV